MKSIYFDNIPDDIMEFYIWPKLSIYVKVLLDKENYLKYHPYIKNNITLYNNYIRDMIRLDYGYVFERLVKENINIWLIPQKHYVYNNITFKDYLNYIHYLINKYNSNSCKNILYENLKNSGLQKKWHKNNINKNIQWIL